MKKTALLSILMMIGLSATAVLAGLIQNDGSNPQPVQNPLQLYKQVISADATFDMGLLLRNPRFITRQSVDRLNRMIDSVADLQMSGKSVDGETLMRAENAKRFLSALWDMEKQFEKQKEKTSEATKPVVTKSVTYSATADPYEPDNSMGEANPIAYGDSVTGHTIDPYDDQDWFSFEGNEGDYVRVCVHTPTPWDYSTMDPRVYLRRDDGYQLANDYDSGPGHDAELWYGPLPYTGSYYLQVRGEYPWKTGEYSLTLQNELPNWNCDPYEPNDTPDEAALLNLGYWYSSCISPPGDVDYYKVDCEVGKLLLVRVYGYYSYGTRLDAKIELISPDGDSVLAEGHNENWVHPVLVFGPIVHSGTYLLKVEAEGGAGWNFGEYRINVGQAWPVEADEYEPDDSPDECNHVQLGDSQAHTIFPLGDHDWFCFEGREGTYVTIEVRTEYNDWSHFRTELELLGTRSNGYIGHIAWGEGRGEGSWSKICYGPLPYTGTYYADVFCWGSFLVPVGSYTISFSQGGLDSYEPDNSLGQANELSFGKTAGHSIAPAKYWTWYNEFKVPGDLDFFHFTADRGDTIYLRAETRDRWDDPYLRLSLLNADSVFLAIDRYSPWIIRYYGLPDSGDYYALVEPRWEGTLGDYTLYFYKPPRADFASDRNVGLPPLTVHFENQSYGGVDSCLWDVAVGSHGGNGIPIRETNPVHQYILTGEHEVSLTVWNPLGSSTKSRWPGDTGFIHVYGPCGYTQLVLVDSSSSPAFKNEGWTNAIDGDIWGWDGTATVSGNPPYATFTFKDGRTKTLTKVRLLTNTGVGHSDRWVRNFHIDVSTDGVNWTTALTATHQGRIKDNIPEIGHFGWWQDFSFDQPVQAKFVKLVIDDPVADWAQIGEFEVYENIQLPDPTLSSISVSSPHFVGDSAVVTLVLRDPDGKPVCGYDQNDITFFLPYNEEGTFGSIVEVDSGVYKTSLTCTSPGIKHVMAAAHGAVLPATGQTEALTQFYNPGEVDASLQLVYGTYTHPGEGWDNAIDGDTEGWDGTVTARGNPCYAIFSFGGFTKTIDKIGILTDTGVGYENRWVCKFQIQVSTTDTVDTAFQTIMTRTRNTGEMVWYKINPPVQAKYIKLILLEPYWGSGWRQLGEFVVHEAVGDLGKEALDNNPENPESFSLSANYPNPFNPTTNIQFSLPEAAHVKLVVFNTLGQKVATLVDDYRQPGVHTVSFDASKLPSGIYFYKIQAGRFSAIRKMVLTK